MNYSKVAVIGLIAVALLSTVVAGVALAEVVGSTSNDNGHDHSEHGHITPSSDATATPQQTPVDEDEVPQDVQESVAGAKMLKKNLSQSDTYENASVQIAQDGEVIVRYGSTADSGTALKEEMGGVAVRYSAVVAEYNETGGLTVVANGVKLMVSSDAAAAHANGKIKQSAFTKTFHWSTVETPSSGE